MNPNHPEFEGEGPIDPDAARFMERAVQWRNTLYATTIAVVGRWVVPACLETATQPVEAAQQFVTGILTGRSL